MARPASLLRRHCVEARRLNERTHHLQEIYGSPGTLKRKDAETPVFGPRTLLDAVYDAGRKGISLQRYKGLGEMNPDQLWETTLNRDARTLLQVKIGDLGEADELLAPDGRCRRAPSRVHPGERARGRQPGRLMASTPHHFQLERRAILSVSR